MASKTSYTTRFSYASSDMAGQLIFQVINLFLFKFYTDVLGITAAVAGTILFIARLEDALDTPIWGIFLDKTKSKYGKSRPWFLWLCFPFALFGVLTFLAPDWGDKAKAIYAGITYIVLGSIYTGINTPVTSILSALTPDPKERVTLTCFRMIGSKAGVLIVNLSLFALIAFFGAGNDKQGIMWTMMLFAAGSILLYLFAFKNLKEVVPVEHKPMPVKRAFQAFKGNWPWIIIFISCFCFWAAFISRFTVLAHFFQYAWGDSKLVTVFAGLDVVSLGAIFLIPWFCKWGGSKATVWGFGLGGAVLAQVVVYFAVAMHSLPLLYVGWIFGILTSGVAMALPFSMLADTVDYGEWKSGVRSAGLLTAIGTAFCLKAGAGLGGAVPAWVMGATGYVANQAQTPEAIGGIVFGFVWLPAVLYILALIPVFYYRKFERMEPKIQEELKLRREGESNV
jgi:sugar (glycoside-pentoside-hexuronide) transporter